MHSQLDSSRLLSLLADPDARPQAGAPGGDFAEALARWLGALDAVRLREALQAIGPPAAAVPASTPAGGSATLAQALHRLRTTLADRILTALADVDVGAGYGPCRRLHMEQQRRMESRIGALRSQVREALAGASPRLRQLARLDATMQQAFGEREQRLLATLPTLLEQRFEHLPDAFVHLWRQVLLAELETRLLPVVGMIEAFSREDAQWQ